jgi:hypothetical protein
METLSHQFIEALAGSRDRLWAIALAKAEALKGGPAGAERLLEGVVRSVFRDAANGVVVDIAGGGGEGAQ